MRTSHAGNGNCAGTHRRFCGHRGLWLQARQLASDLQYCIGGANTWEFTMVCLQAHDQSFCPASHQRLLVPAGATTKLNFNYRNRLFCRFPRISISGSMRGTYIFHGFGVNRMRLFYERPPLSLPKYTRWFIEHRFRAWALICLRVYSGYIRF